MSLYNFERVERVTKIIHLSMTDTIDKCLQFMSKDLSKGYSKFESNLSTNFYSVKSNRSLVKFLTKECNKPTEIH